MSYRQPARLRTCVAALGLAGALMPALAGQASAETFNVSNTSQLEEAVQKANANSQANTIVLADSTAYLPLKTLNFTDTAGPQVVEGPTDFPGAKLEGGNLEAEHPEVIVVHPGVSLALERVIESTAGSGAAVALEDLGNLTIEASTIAGNNATSVLVAPGASATVRNATISDAAGIGLVNDGTASFFNSTVAFNAGGGIEDNVGGLSLTNTIVAENGRHDCTKPASASDHSLDSDSSCGVGALSGMNPLLGTLRYNGGPTTIHSLQPGSPAIDAGNPGTCTASDQRGQPRPDPEPAGDPACDIGADEYNETPPEIIVPSEVNASATSPAGAKVTYTAEAKSSDDKIREFSCSPKSGTTFKTGTTTVTCTAKDGHETTATKSFPVTVKDTTAPELHVPATITAAAESTSGTMVSYTVTATDPDNLASELTVSCAPPSGSTFAIGETTVECSASDPAGNTSTASFKVIVKPFELEMKEWLFKGSVTGHKAGQTLFTLPEGSRFNGHATIPGALEGNTTVPPFQSMVKLFGFLQVTLGWTFNEEGPVTGTITNDPSHAGNILINATAQDRIGITSITLFGLTLSTSCATAGPATFELETSEPASQFVASGATFSGEVTLPAIKCGGLFGKAFEPFLRAVVSGPHNPFTFTIEP
jgi:hypothetical protein